MVYRIVIGNLRKKNIWTPINRNMKQNLCISIIYSLYLNSPWKIFSQTKNLQPFVQQNGLLNTGIAQCEWDGHQRK